MDRRAFIAYGGAGLALAAGLPVLSCTPVLPIVPNWSGSLWPLKDYGPVGAADANGLKLPDGFTSRVVATTGQQVASTGYVWHANPDGGACFATGDGGWIYVSNNESLFGSVSMVRFDASGAIVEARRICNGTVANCAGGATPWGTWLTCEEVASGRVWECDPTGVAPPVARLAMGQFTHEAAAVDEVRKVVYMTEDVADGAFYRFVPTTWPDLSAGVLQVLTESAGVLSWQVVADPDGSPTATRLQVPNTKVFNGGEGICIVGPWVYFTTKGDNRVWGYDAVQNTLTVVYDDNTASPANLTGVDNITAGAGGLFAAEDGGNMQIVMVDPSGSGTNRVFAELTGVTGSEITGPAFSPDGTRLYFSSQRSPGRTYEVTGPF